MEETIFIISASVVASSLCGGLLSYLFCKAEPSPEHKEIVKANKALDEFLVPYEKILDERKELLEKFNEIKQQINSAVINKRSGHLFFNPSLKENISDPNSRLEYEQFNALCTLLNSYPHFEPDRGNDLLYVNSIHDELEEHHTKTMDAAERYFRIVNETTTLLGKHIEVSI